MVILVKKQVLKLQRSTKLLLTQTFLISKEGYVCEVSAGEIDRGRSSQAMYGRSSI